MNSSTSFSKEIFFSGASLCVGLRISIKDYLNVYLKYLKILLVNNVCFYKFSNIESYTYVFPRLSNITSNPID